MRTLISIIVFLALPVWADSPGDVAWQFSIADDESGYGDVHILHQDAGNSIKDESASNVVPRLEFRCTPGSSDVTARIDWKRFISSFSTEVGFKVDDGRFTWLKWKVDSSEKVTLSPSVDDSAKLIELLGSGTDLTVEISPYSQAPVTVTLALAEFGDSLAELQDKCR
jgi:hypothetical protein